MTLGRAVVSCPVDGCDWAMDEPDLHLTAERYVLPAGVPLSEALESAIGEASMRRAGELERRIREHAESHDVLDFLRTIQRLNQDLAQQGCGIRPHHYPSDTSSITCPRCLRTSHHPTDVAEGYCGACHDWTSPR